MKFFNPCQTCHLANLPKLVREIKDGKQTKQDIELIYAVITNRNMFLQNKIKLFSDNSSCRKLSNYQQKLFFSFNNTLQINNVVFLQLILNVI